ncbi:hypothetical protein BHE74_00001476 [Ensete ventricosum]|nr:hypothetical protein BHE74_00001476 [Ensete ventricosum]
MNTRTRWGKWRWPAYNKDTSNGGAGNAKASQARDSVGIRAIDRDPPRHRHAVHLVALHVFEARRTRAQRPYVMHQLMVRQVGQRCRHAVTLQVSRARAVDHRHAAQQPRHHRLVWLRAHSQHAIEPLGEQVDLAVGAADFQLDQRVGIHEFRQARQDQFPRHHIGHVHANPPAKLGFILTKQPFQFFHVRQQILAALIQHATILGRLHLARGALQQARAEQFFQRLHMLGHGGAWQPQTFAGAGKARQFGNAHEGTQQL